MKISFIKQKTSEAIKFAKSGAGLLVVAMMIANVINFIFNSFLGRELSLENLGLVTLINTLWYIAGIFINSISSAVNHRTSYLSAKDGGQSSVCFWKATLRFSVIAALLITVVWIVAVPFLDSFFHIENILILSLFSPVIFLGVIVATNRGFIQGNLMFQWLALVVIIESFSKLLLAMIFVYTGLNEWVFTAIPLSIFINAVVSFFIAKRISTNFVSRDEYVPAYDFPSSFYFASIVSSVSSIIFLSMDIILVKHFFDPSIAGTYALLALIGKMIYFFGALPGVFMVTFVSRAEGLGKNPRTTFYFILSIAVFLTAVGFIALGPSGYLFIPILFGLKSSVIIKYLIPYTLAISFFTITNIIVSYHLAKKQYIFPFASFITSMIMALGIIVDHDSLWDVVNTMLSSSFLGLVLVSSLHFFESGIKYIDRGMKDFLDVFKYKEKFDNKLEGKKILIFNWRDTKHVFAGGAEIYIHEVAKGLVSQGNQVTLFSGNDGKSLRRETVDGVDIVRRGGFYLVYVWAFLYYVLRFRGNYDLIIDCHNGIPFFTPLYVRKPIICILHHVHQEVFRKSLAWPLSTIACFLERDMMPIVYRNTKFVTISESTRKEMSEYGLVGKSVNIIYSGVDLNQFKPGAKSSRPTVIYLGRLKDYKSVDVLVQAFKLVIDEVKDAVLYIAGSGEEQLNLKKLAKSLGLNDKQVIFTGKISEEEKIKLLQSSWVMVNPSFMEGWGITTIEANACGTPVIGANVPGLRDSVRDLETGYLVTHGDINGFADKILHLLRDDKLRTEMSDKSVAWANNFTWNDSIRKFLSLI